MTDPVVAQKAPYPQDLAVGDYWWCACGLSAKQPFCDGSHKVTSLTPLKFAVTEAKQYWLCGCKQTKNAPYCDGSHKLLT